MESRSSLIVMAHVLLSLGGCREAPADSDKAGASEKVTTIAVELFAVTDSGPKDWNASAFADSVAARLALMNVVNVARHQNGRNAGTYVLRGDVSSRNGRMVLGVRLWHGDDPAPVWTATFWRSEGPMNSLVEDVATGAAEALGAEIARLSVSKGARR